MSGSVLHILTYLPSVTQLLSVRIKIHSQAVWLQPLLLCSVASVCKLALSLLVVPLVNLPQTEPLLLPPRPVPAALRSSGFATSKPWGNPRVVFSLCWSLHAPCLDHHQFVAIRSLRSAENLILGPPRPAPTAHWDLLPFLPELSWELPACQRALWFQLSWPPPVLSCSLHVSVLFK